MQSSYKFYQYFFNVPNADVIRFLKVLTFLDLEEIDRQDGNMERPEYPPDIAQKRLAEEVTRFVLGDDGLQEALRPGAETKLDWKAFEGIAEDLRSYSLTYEEVLNASVVDLCVASGLLLSKSTAHRQLKQGGLYLNNFGVNSENSFEADDVVDGESPAAIGRLKEQGCRADFLTCCCFRKTVSLSHVPILFSDKKCREFYSSEQQRLCKNKKPDNPVNLHIRCNQLMRRRICKLQ